MTNDNNKILINDKNEYRFFLDNSFAIDNAS